jgi:hypothetical protein
VSGDKNDWTYLEQQVVKNREEMQLLGMIQRTNPRKIKMFISRMIKRTIPSMIMVTTWRMITKA